MKTQNDFGITGIITATINDQSTLTAEQKAFNENLKKQYDNGIISREDYRKSLFYGKEKQKITIKNKISKVAGFSIVAKFLVGQGSAYTGGINKALFGDGSGTTSENDTQLFHEIFRNDEASRSAIGNQVLLTAFIDTTEFSGDITEFGNCINGTATADTGELWSHIAGFLWTKDNSSTLTVSQLYTINNI